MKENQTLLVLEDKTSSKSFYRKETANKQLIKMTLENAGAEFDRYLYFRT